LVDLENEKRWRHCWVTAIGNTIPIPHPHVSRRPWVHFRTIQPVFPAGQYPPPLKDGVINPHPREQPEIGPLRIRLMGERGPKIHPQAPEEKLSKEAGPLPQWLFSAAAAQGHCD